MKNSLIVEKHINPNIKLGDKVRLINGSALSCVEYPDKEFYIIYDYKRITGSSFILEEITGEVIETCVNNCVINSEYGQSAYLQDITVKVGNVTFRTSSNFVKKIDIIIPEEKTYSREEVLKLLANAWLAGVQKAHSPLTAKGYGSFIKKNFKP